MTRQPQPQSGSTDRWASHRAALATLALAGLALLSGCATTKDELMPTNGVTMQELWKQGSTQGAAMPASAGQQAAAAARGELRRPIGTGQLINEHTHYTRNAANEIYSQFSRLPNPDLVMYIYPHLAGGESVPVPGYSTIFPLYNKPQYAMPGEGARSVGRTR
ncbi:TIGR03751 family conjugal transfer lipoprotein [Halomonas sp. McH1-25]|uniref:TIGR03751 family conjugal transfer lipoprotein n=1 Tax=unclassified Halomonas TaxID=2609666 RepID=UPI001EF6B2BC|nr:MULTISPECIES: TIGR03751 family conjugal transfer lipoprotein [unclassified Halomonas]MCG7601785.1 TIGR03751 family conjugal transfer lipoprotein [Halomonas sp. McH1-25]MCP1343961.1 TIGR03751 family conjugal transfer lipoprotein [Halomonas sp. FL8]MCP1361806.1 TIGR03751 family conjugal transfer lipoprotein [Halomonas sp. BBD45]MCP1367382.1 TIGR03751 family conjugal transfer lipoprotein [Halomonas sp. BBD48]